MSANQFDKPCCESRPFREMGISADEICQTYLDMKKDDSPLRRRPIAVSITRTEWLPEWPKFRYTGEYKPPAFGQWCWNVGDYKPTKWTLPNALFEAYILERTTPPDYRLRHVSYKEATPFGSPEDAFRLGRTSNGTLGYFAESAVGVEWLKLEEIDD